MAVFQIVKGGLMYEASLAGPEVLVQAGRSNALMLGSYGRSRERPAVSRRMAKRRTRHEVSFDPSRDRGVRALRASWWRRPELRTDERHGAPRRKARQTARTRATRSRSARRATSSLAPSADRTSATPSRTIATTVATTTKQPSQNEAKPEAGQARSGRGERLTASFDRVGSNRPLPGTSRGLEYPTTRDALGRYFFLSSTGATGAVWPATNGYFEKM